MREIKFRAWIKEDNKMTKNFDLFDFFYALDSDHGDGSIPFTVIYD